VNLLKNKAWMKHIMLKAKSMKKVSYSYDASFHDLESQEVLEEPLDVVSFSSNKEHDDCIDDFIHVGRRRWDVSCFYFDGDPLYEDDNGPRIKNAKLFPLERTFITIVD
jgi:hypothetical protein